MSTPTGEAPSVGYLELLRRNPAFRRIWLGGVVSLMGDWFTAIALFSMTLELTGKAEALGLVLIARFIPTVLFGAMAGVVADRLPRRSVSPLFNPRKTPEPSDAASVYGNATRAGMGTGYGRGEQGWYRYFSDNSGGVHFSGLVPPSEVPAAILRGP